MLNIANTATSKDRKRSSRVSKEKRISAILKAARLEFELQGYEKAKVSNIAKRVNIVEGTIFHYFGSKQGLVFGVMEAFYKEITADLVSGLTEISGVRNRLYYIIKFHLSVFIESAAFCSVIVTETRRGADSALQNDLRELNKVYTDHLITTIKEGIATGELRADVSIFFIRNTVYGSMESAMWAYLNDGKAVDIIQNAELLTDLIYDGMGVRVETVDREEVNLLIKKLNTII